MSSIISYQYQGCYKDDGSTRALPTKISSNVSSIDQCAQLAQSNNATVFGLQAGKECWIGTDLSRAEKYGTKSGCSTLGNNWKNQVYKMMALPQSTSTSANRTYTYQGCYNDKSSRAIPTQKGNVSSIDQCAQIAQSNNATVFGVQSGSACFIGNNLSQAQKYGVNNSYNSCGLMGGALTNLVYTTPANTTSKYQMSSSELLCYQSRYPDLAGKTPAQLQKHWSDTGYLQNRNNQCPSPQNTSGTYNFKGCYNENSNTRAIPNYQGSGSSVDKCQAIATSKQQNVYGLQNNGQCWTGNSTDQAYQYGQNYNGNLCGNLGGSSTNMVYVSGTPYVPITPTPALSTINFATEQFKNSISNMDNDSSSYKSYKYVVVIIIIIILIIIMCIVGKK